MPEELAWTFFRDAFIDFNFKTEREKVLFISSGSRSLKL